MEQVKSTRAARVEKMKPLTSQHRDQASRLRELAGGHRTGANTLAIVSGKGGVGKTNVAVNLSICLAARHSRVTLIDLDMGLANADLLLGLTPKYTLAQVISGSRTLKEITLAGPRGLRFIPGASGLDQLANLSEFERQSLLLQMQNHLLRSPFYIPFLRIRSCSDC